MSLPDVLTSQAIEDARKLWDYHRLDHEVRPADVALGLGSHDPGVARRAAELYLQGVVSCLMFSGANSRTTLERFPRGEAEHYREIAVAAGVPQSRVIVETTARNTGQNFSASCAALAAAGVEVRSLIVVSKPYMQRRAYATCRKVWPEVQVRCTAEQVTFEDYLTRMGRPHMVVGMLAGDLRRLLEYPAMGYSIPQEVPSDVREAYDRLKDAGFDR